MAATRKLDSQEIKRLFLSGMTRGEIGDKFGVGPGIIHYHLRKTGTITPGKRGPKPWRDKGNGTGLLSELQPSAAQTAHPTGILQELTAVLDRVWNTLDFDKKFEALRSLSE